jgi:hypothetical protein
MVTDKIMALMAQFEQQAPAPASRKLPQKLSRKSSHTSSRKSSQKSSRKSSRTSSRKSSRKSSQKSLPPPIQPRRKAPLPPIPALEPAQSRLTALAPIQPSRKSSIQSLPEPTPLRHLTKKNTFVSKVGSKVRKTLRRVFGKTKKSNKSKEYDLDYVINNCITYLKNNEAIAKEGIFRVSGVQSKKNQILDNLRNKDFNHEQEGMDVDSVASALKNVLRETKIFKINEQTNLNIPDDADNKIKFLKEFLDTIPEEYKPSIRTLFLFLREIANNHEANKMTPTNLGVVFGPTLLITGDPANNHQNQNHYNKIIEEIINNVDALFPHIIKHKTAVKTDADIDVEIAIKCIDYLEKQRLNINYLINNVFNKKELSEPTNIQIRLYEDLKLGKNINEIPQIIIDDILYLLIHIIKKHKIQIYEEDNNLLAHKLSTYIDKITKDFKENVDNEYKNLRHLVKLLSGSNSDEELDEKLKFLLNIFSNQNTNA